MKWLALALLILNLGVAGIFIGMNVSEKTSAETHAPLNVDRLNLRASSRTRITGPALPAQPAATMLCVEWRGLEQADFALAREQLKGMTGDHVMSFTEIPIDSQQWVIFPPLPSQPAASAKLTELTALGVQDMFVVTAGTWVNALSLGLYGNEELARRRVRELEEKGVHGLQIESQPKQGTAYYFMIRSDDADALKSLNEAKTAYPSSALSRVACRN